jgi:hypothetical protein
VAVTTFIQIAKTNSSVRFSPAISREQFDHHLATISEYIEPANLQQIVITYIKAFRYKRQIEDHIERTEAVPTERMNAASDFQTGFAIVFRILAQKAMNQQEFDAFQRVLAFAESSLSW